MSLYRVTVWNDHENKDRTFEAFVLATDEQQAIEIIEEELWTIGGMEIKNVIELDISISQLLCWNDTYVLGLEEEE